MKQETFITGPYRATKLWNDAVRSFHKGMPLSRHWRGLRQYDNCFTSGEAINWLHQHLCSNPNFGPGISREQTLKLLRKFFKSGLLVEARGNKIHPDELQDNRELLRFSNRSPLKALRTPQRAPLAPLATNILKLTPFNAGNGASPELLSTDPYKKSHRLTTSRKSESPVTPYSSLSSQKENNFNEERDQSCNSATFSSFPSESEEEAWRQILFDRLEGVSEQLMVVGDGSAPLLAPILINPRWVKQNCIRRPSGCYVQPRGLMQTDLPSWILTAMKSLANWPNSSESICNIPNYPGVEMDIFKIVLDFFVSMVVPLIPYELYDPILRLYIGAEFLDVSYRSPSNPCGRGNCSGKLPLVDNRPPKHFSLNDSVEDLMLDISVNLNENCVESPHNRPLEAKRDRPLSRTSIENRTPTPVNEILGTESVPQTLKLHNLKAYTNFKDSLLYPALRSLESESPSLHIPVKSHSEERRTLKSLKNRPKSNSALKSLKNRSPCLGEDFDEECVDPYKKLLRTEDLDNFSLPPNSCFETAFTSDSPRTRIIPQKSVDTIHLRSSGRPKSIAVSSFFSSTAINSAEVLNSLSSFNRRMKLISRPSENFENRNGFNRSSSEGNFFRVNDCSGSSSASTSVQSLIGDDKVKSSKSKLKHSRSKGSLASRVRDSIKRRKEKSDVSKSKSRVLKRVSKSHEALLSYTDDHSGTYTDPSRLRTQSGGYANPMLIQGYSPSESSSIKSAFSDFAHVRSESGIGSSRPSSTPELIDSRMSTLRSQLDMASCSDTSSLLRKRRLSPMLSSTPSELSTRDCSSRCSSASRLRPYTPTGCLSHSLTSCVSNSMYVSALSELSRVNSYSTLASNPLPLKSRTPSSHSVTSASPNFYPMDEIRSTPLSESDYPKSETPEEDLEPDLPTRIPLPKQSSSELDCGVNQLLHDYENVNVLASQKPLSCSASDLSDPWKDRTPYGRVPPYMRGGMWHHYSSSPRLLTKAGKDVCIEALQYVLLLLEPLRRRKLLLLLRMMRKASANEKLQLQDGHAQTRSLMVKSFARCILLSEREGEYDEVLVLRIVTFLMDNHEAIFSPPQHLPVLVYRRLASDNRKNKSNGVCVGAPDSNGAYCLQVSQKTFEEQQLTGSQKFLAELLDQIVGSQMTDKDKRKKLKEFKMHYPEIYKHRFPDNVALLPARRHAGGHRPRLKGLRKIASIASFGKAKSIRI